MKAKPCRLCGGAAKFVYYAIPEQDNPDGWDYGEDGMEPLILLKRLECVDCGSTVPQLVIACDDAVRYWNGELNEESGLRPILQRYGEGLCEMESEGE